MFKLADHESSLEILLPFCRYTILYHNVSGLHIDWIFILNNDLLWANLLTTNDEDERIVVHAAVWEGEETATLHFTVELESSKQTLFAWWMGHLLVSAQLLDVACPTSHTPPVTASRLYSVILSLTCIRDNDVLPSFCVLHLAPLLYSNVFKISSSSRVFFSSGLIKTEAKEANVI